MPLAPAGTNQTRNPLEMQQGQAAVYGNFRLVNEVSAKSTPNMRLTTPKSLFSGLCVNFFQDFIHMSWHADLAPNARDRPLGVDQEG